MDGPRIVARTLTVVGDDVDEYGNVWLGSAETVADNSIVYRFRDGTGKTLTGISSGLVVTLRDEKGNTWRGAVD